MKKLASISKPGTLIISLKTKRNSSENHSEFFSRFKTVQFDLNLAGAGREMTEMDAEAPEVEMRETEAGLEVEERETGAGLEAGHGIDHMTVLRTDPETGPTEPLETNLKVEIPEAKTGTPGQSPSGIEGIKLQ